MYIFLLIKSTYDIYISLSDESPYFIQDTKSIIHPRRTPKACFVLDSNGILHFACE
jgi:hypothetical protein